MIKDSVRSSTKSRCILVLISFLIVCLAAGCAARSDSAQQQTAAAASDKPAPAAANNEKRTLKHLGGETTIVGNPQKIAVLDYRLADTLLAVGVKPYAMTTYLGETNLPYIDGKPLSGVIPLGDTANLEAVLQASPDLIIGRTPELKIYEQLSKIAPTLIIDYKGDSWRQNFLETAGYVQREKEANQWLAEYDKKAASVRSEIAPYIKPGETFLYMRVLPKEIRIHSSKELFSATLFQDLKLTPVAGLDTIDRFQPVSLEKLPDYNADHIFVEVGGPVIGGDKPAEQNMAALSQSEVWKSLKAVKSNHVYTVPQWVISDYPNIKNKSLELIRDALKKASKNPINNSTLPLSHQEEGLHVL
jgi:iron complex transport system substrate-binding protein